MKKVFFLAALLLSASLQAAQWSVLTYIQADNNLAPFASYNISDMAKGIAADTPDVNILVQWDQPQNNKTWRYKVEKNTAIETDSLSQEMGIQPVQELIDSATWMKTKFPADHYAITLWNHGSGVEDKSLKVSRLWVEIPGVDRAELKQRGILYDDSQNTYVTTPQLGTAFNQIAANLGKKIDVIGMDACLMAMIEIAYEIKDSSKFFVGSQEIEQGEGWPYSLFIRPLTTNPSLFDAKTLANTIARVYGVYYQTADTSHTQSAIDLSKIVSLKNNINTVVNALDTCKKYDEVNVKNAVIKARLSAQSFYVPRYIDLYSFYNGLCTQFAKFKIPKVTAYKTGLNVLKTNLNYGKKLITTVITTNAHGAAKPGAYGISIYYPDPKAGLSSIHSSYLATKFAKESQWLKFIKTYRTKQ